MPSNLPKLFRPGGIAPLDAVVVGRAERRAEMAVARHALDSWVQTQRDQIDSQALADAITVATEEELRFLDYGLTAANGSDIKREIVARKVELFSQVNNQRLTRTFGR